MNDVPRIVSIVEGRGESTFNAVPILIRRIAQEIGCYVDSYRTVRTRRDTFPRSSSERERALRLARADADPNGAILVLLDSDGEPPCVNRAHRSSLCLLGPELLRAVSPLASGLPIAVVMAEREFEAWFVAAAESLVFSGDLRSGTTAPVNPDVLHDPKGWLSERMRSRPQYRPAADQARLTEHFSLQMARDNSPSFDSAYQEIERLIRAAYADQA
ncbi:MAG: DUF4276 family protein [Chloroflexota bacterium]